MQFDPNNPIIKLLAQGMEREGEGLKEEALLCFSQAWTKADNNFEKYITAHYIARHQDSISAKLHWDEKALQIASGIDDEHVKATYPSLYLNIAKCHEDLKDYSNASKNYQLALSFISFLDEDGYGKMIIAGIHRGLERIKSIQEQS